MTLKRIISTAKTWLLAFLVGASLVLSYELWIGFWGGGSKAVGTEVLPTPASHTPTTQELETPARIIVYDARTDKYTLAMPGTTPFAEWMKLMTSGMVTLSREVPVNSVKLHDTVELDFGYSLNRTQLLELIPSLKSYNVSGGTSSIILDWNPSTNAVYILVPTADGTTETLMETTIYGQNFAKLLQQADEGPAWREITTSGSPPSFVPAKSIDMIQSLWQYKDNVQMSLVHSFFLNPLALTSLNESGQSYVWTDGSRIVWWNQPKMELTFQDPNDVNVNSVALPTVGMAVDFIRAHGGAPINATALSEGLIPGTQYIDSFTMRPHLFGYPLVDGSADYQVQFTVGQITEYQRPIWTLTDMVSEKRVRVIGYSQLTKDLHRISPSTQWSQVSVELGYATIPLKNHEVRLVPAYVISSDGITMWTLSATTGQLMKGWDAP